MAQVHGELKIWHKVTVDFAGPQSSETAATFRNYRLDVAFTNKQTGETLKVPGYFAADGNAAETGATSGDVWRVHFNPPSQGEWTYTASFRTGTDVAASTSSSAGQPLAAFAGQSGSFTVGPTDKTGDDFRAKGMLEYTDEHYLRHAGTGKPFLKGGADSPENFLAYYQFDNTKDIGGGDVPTADGLHHYAPHVADWRSGDPTWQGGEGKGIIGAINYLADHDVNSQYFLTMNVGGDGQDVWPWISPTARTTYDVSKLAQWEIVFDHMDKRGVMMHVVTQETENDQLLNSGSLGVERAVYYRELIARFGHHNGVVWNLGEENSNTDAQRKAFADFFQAVDPYDHPVVVHTFTSNTQQDAVYNPLLGHEDFDGASLQADNAYARTKKWVEASADAGRPWVVSLDEWGKASDGVLPDGASGLSANHADAREAMWSSLFAGGAGVEWYFGYAYPHSDLTLEDFGSRESVWAWTDHALDFFRAHLPFTEMQSADALTSTTGDYVFANPGEIYTIYLPDGGSASLNLNGETGTYEVKWFDPRNGGALKDGTVTEIAGGGVRSLGTAPSDTAKDWAVLVRQTEGPPDSQTPTEPVTLVASAGVLNGTTGPQAWSEDVTISALAANGSASAMIHSTDGLGIKGGRFDTQIDHMPANNTSEQLTLEFDGIVTDVILRLGRMSPAETDGINRETGSWTAFDAAGNQVANGVLDPADGTKIATRTYDLAIDAGGQFFTELLLKPTGYNNGSTGAPNGDSSDFTLQQLTYTSADPDEDSLSVLAPMDEDLVDGALIA